jgi:phosphate:Na+ symporter
MFQTLINLMAIMLFLPMINPISRLLERKIPDGENNASFVKAPLEDADITLLRDEVMHLLERDLEFHDMVLDLEKPEAEGLLENFKSFARKSGNTSTFYNRLKATEGDLIAYYMRVRDDIQDTTNTEVLMECIRQILHSAKSIKDVHHNITELRESGQDSLHVHYHRLQQNWETFRKKFSERYRSGTSTYDDFMRQAYLDMEDHNKSIMQQLHEGKLQEIEASTLMNIERELLSSKKSLIRAAEKLA